MTSPTSSFGPLRGVRVLELSSGHAAALAGHFLLGYGASVTHVAATETTWLAGDVRSYVHRGKSTVGREELARLLCECDLVVSDASPAILDTLGISWGEIHSRRPELVIVSVTPFGLVGPYANFEHTNATAFALGGIMGLTGDADRSPLVTGGSNAYALAGINAFAAAATGWLGRCRHGRGEVFDLAGQECSTGMLEYYGPSTSYDGVPIDRLGNHTRATWAIYPCLDGWSGVFALERQTPALFALLDDPELAEERFANPLLRRLQQNDEELTAKLYVYFCDKTAAELRDISLSTRVPIAMVRTPRELLDDPGLGARGLFEDNGVGRVPGRPFPGLTWSIPGSDADVRADAHPSQSDDSNASALPLVGVRVLDLTMMWAGPFATMRMAEMGADVIKIESPSAWDNIRTLLPQEDATEPWNTSFYFNAYNRAKRSLTLDLAQPEGRELFLKLVKTADVVIENYRADVLDKLDLSVDTLRSLNPQLVVVSMAAFGKEGPDRDYVGFGPVIETMSGLASLTGYGDGEPFKTGISYCDPVAGTFAVAAVGLGLAARDQSGAGLWIDLAQREAAMTLIGEAFLAGGRGELPVHRGCRDEFFAPQNCYPTADGEWVVVSVRSDAEWHELCTHINLHAMSSLTAEQRHTEHDRIDDHIATWSRSLPADDVMLQLQSLGIPAGAVRTTSTVLTDQNLVARGYWQNLPHPKMNSYRQCAPLWSLMEAPERSPRRHAPLFGEHNEEVLRGELNLSDLELAGLSQHKVIADQPVNPGVG